MVVAIIALLLMVVWLAHRVNKLEKLLDIVVRQHNKLCETSEINRKIEEERNQHLVDSVNELLGVILVLIEKNQDTSRRLYGVEEEIGIANND